jgi:hypothetical protein
VPSFDRVDRQRRRNQVVVFDQRCRTRVGGDADGLDLGGQRGELLDRLVGELVLGGFDRRTTEVLDRLREGFDVGLLVVANRLDLLVGQGNSPAKSRV